ncbi:MAG: MotA/TolQ/ExbB proton channel family protein [Candidatus Melainabacteria bacterium]|nr:MotA/TolQ/ExbB proton channel family protein [Candidatus Melainabacteria bacterium]
MNEETIVEEGLGLAEAAGLTEGAAEQGFNFFHAFWEYFQADFISSIPISLCSLLVFGVIIERSMFYNKNNRDISVFIHNLQMQLEKGNLEAAQMLSAQLGSVVGEVAEEGVRLLAVQKEDFSRAYDITVNLVTRKLQKYLPILATIGAVAPFLGLFGTVSGVIKALFRMSLGSDGASLTMIGEISNALIATGYGLFIAIIAVVAYNWFSNIVRRYGDDFQLLKLLFLSFSTVDFAEFNDLAEVEESDQAYVGANQNQDKPDYPDFLK